MGKSGIGRELGRHGLAEYRETKHVYENLRPAAVRVIRRSTALAAVESRSRPGSTGFAEQRAYRAGAQQDGEPEAADGMTATCQPTMRNCQG